MCNNCIKFVTSLDIGYACFYAYVHSRTSKCFKVYVIEDGALNSNFQICLRPVIYIYTIVLCLDNTCIFDHWPRRFFIVPPPLARHMLSNICHSMPYAIWEPSTIQSFFQYGRRSLYTICMLLLCKISPWRYIWRVHTWYLSNDRTHTRPWVLRSDGRRKEGRYENLSEILLDLISFPGRSTLAWF